MVTTLQQSDYTQCQSTVYVKMVRMVYFTLCIFYFKQASKSMFLPKRNEQAGSYQKEMNKQVLTKGGPPKKMVPCLRTMMFSSAIAGT